MSETVYIYGLVDPRDNHIRYVGKTKHKLEKRLREHLFKNNLETNNYKNFWIKEILKNNLSPDIILIEECNEDDWQEREIYWISYYRELLGNKLTNSTDGGEGLNNPSIEIRKKMGDTHRGHKTSDETKQKLSLKFSGKNNPMYGKKHSKEIVDKLRLLSTGKKLSDAVKKKISEICSGRIMTEEEKYNNRLSRKKNNNGKYMGICKVKKYNKFYAKLRVNEKYYTSKSVNTIEEAALAFDELSIKYLGDKAVLNFPEIYE